MRGKSSEIFHICHKYNIYNIYNTARTKIPSYITDIKTNTTSRKHWRESAITTAAHILVCLTQEGKSIREIAKDDFDNNLELVSVWADYMVGINWMQYRPVNSENRWIVTSTGKNWVQRIFRSTNDG